MLRKLCRRFLLSFNNFLYKLPLFKAFREKVVNKMDCEPLPQNKNLIST